MARTRSGLCWWIPAAAANWQALWCITRAGVRACIVNRAVTSSVSIRRIIWIVWSRCCRPYGNKRRPAAAVKWWVSVWIRPDLRRSLLIVPGYRWLYCRNSRKTQMRCLCCGKITLPSPKLQKLLRRRMIMLHALSDRIICSLSAVFIHPNGTGPKRCTCYARTLLCGLRLIALLSTATGSRQC